MGTSRPNPALGAAGCRPQPVGGREMRSAVDEVL